MTKQLVDNICAETVFESLYNRYSKNLHDFLYYKYGEQYSPKDKVQEAFIKLWDNCKQIVPSKAKSYLFTVANNLMLNEVKHQQVVLKHRSKPVKLSTNENPEFILQQQEYLKSYQNALSKLSEEQRTAFLLNKVEGKKHLEIAEMLGVTRKVVEYRIYSAFDLLKKELEGFYIK
ncbi:MAG: sigma-70 family RNA polymerase sigma factor [Flavobacteriaceae bacterium]|nr:sigma-70 family RNA polymerase sigma factor [Bacteroidia bacterium]MBT8287172.1 sigma-70 family RNA polymerase sigma factor [Bacteroidia bacterium]NNF74689.1 sigma-70 family RNA polymerase sigma factor [Flavobacteriaceae bacterium]NNK73345.1 sigma-70 family RNA polymerase sigma factor [Flavobacteriaceae bacterium]